MSGSDLRSSCFFHTCREANSSQMRNSLCRKTKRIMRFAGSVPENRHSLPMILHLPENWEPLVPDVTASPTEGRGAGSPDFQFLYDARAYVLPDVFCARVVAPAAWRCGDGAIGAESFNPPPSSSTCRAGRWSCRARRCQSSCGCQRGRRGRGN